MIMPGQAGLYEKTNNPELTADTLKSAPPEPGILTERATALAKTGRIAEAERVFKAALSMDPERVEAITGLGNIRLIQERYQEALTQYARTLRLSPEEPYALYNSALSLEKLGRPQDALPFYERFITAAKKSGKFKKPLEDARRQAAYLKRTE